MSHVEVQADGVKFFFAVSFVCFVRMYRLVESKSLDDVILAV